MWLVSVSVMSIYGSGNGFQKKSHTNSKDKDRKHLSVVERSEAQLVSVFLELARFRRQWQRNHYHFVAISALFAAEFDQ